MGGAGAALKQVVMSAIVPAQVRLAETLAYGAERGVDREALLDALAVTPLGALTDRLRPALDAPQPTRYALGLAAKDLALDPSPVQTLAGAARARLTDAARAGFADADLSAVLALPGGREPVEKINPPTVPATNGYYSHATLAGGFLFVSGQVALDDADRVIAPGDMLRQSEAVMANVAKILADQGLTLDHVTHIRTFVTDMDKLPEYGEVRRRYFPGTPPASTTVEVGRLFRDGLMLEVEIVAVAGRT
ncbi:hypothetical protein GCM10027589_29620 [Actinocorallia lasiicapitis]